MGIAELIQLALALVANGSKIISSAEAIYAAIVQSGEMTSAQLAKFQADYDAAKTDPAWTPDA